MSFARKLHDLRLARRLSLQNVADAVGISKAHVFNLEKGLAANPSMELVVKLAELFRVRVADLVGDNPEADDQPPEMVAMFRDLIYVNTTNAAYVPDYWKWDVMAAYKVTKNAVLQLNIYNLNNAHYYAQYYQGHAVPASGRWASLSLRVRY